MTNLDTAGRTIEGYANTFGNIDQGGDVVHPGAFSKTLAERGGAIKFLWQHNPAEPIGKPVEIREDPKGLFVKAVISDTMRGRDALALLKDGAISGLSIGYDAIKGGTDYSKTDTGETVRNLREVKLWEFSLVTFPMNEAAGVTALKAIDGYEGKPYNVFRDGDKWRVYKVDENGDPTGDPLGEHDDEASARRQVRAIYANENNGKAGRRLRGAMREKLAAMRSTLDELEAWADYEDAHPEEPPDATIEKSAAGAGPDTPPTQDNATLLQEIEFQLKQIELSKE